MKVSSLSQHFSNLAALLGSSGAKKELLDDFAAVNRCLTPFTELNIGQFADFLVKAEEYHRTGILPATAVPTRKVPVPRVAKTPAASAEDIAKRVRELYERAAKPEATADMVEAELAIVDSLKRLDELLVVAKVLHADGGTGRKTIASLKDAIKKAVRDMLDESQRLRQ